MQQISFGASVTYHAVSAENLRDVRSIFCDCLLLQDCIVNGFPGGEEESTYDSSLFNL